MGGYGPQRAPEPGTGAAKFQINIVFPNAGQTETIEIVQPPDALDADEDTKPDC